jgi:hypothetical protein
LALLQNLNRDLVDFLLQKINDQMLREGIQELASKSKVFKEEDLCSVNDLKERYK